MAANELSEQPPPGGCAEVVVDLSKDNKREMLTGERTKELLEGLKVEVSVGFRRKMTEME